MPHNRTPAQRAWDEQVTARVRQRQHEIRVRQASPDAFAALIDRAAQMPCDCSPHLENDGVRYKVEARCTADCAQHRGERGCHCMRCRGNHILTAGIAAAELRRRKPRMAAPSQGVYAGVLCAILEGDCSTELKRQKLEALEEWRTKGKP